MSARMQNKLKCDIIQLRLCEHLLFSEHLTNGCQILLIDSECSLRKKVKVSPRYHPVGKNKKNRLNWNWNFNKSVFVCVFYNNNSNGYSQAYKTKCSIGNETVKDCKSKRWLKPQNLR